MKSKTIAFSHLSHLIFTFSTLLACCTFPGACMQASKHDTNTHISTGSCTICNYLQLQQAHNLLTGLESGMLHLIA